MYTVCVNKHIYTNKHTHIFVCVCVFISLVIIAYFCFISSTKTMLYKFHLKVYLVAKCDLKALKILKWITMAGIKKAKTQVNEALIFNYK